MENLENTVVVDNENADPETEFTQTEEVIDTTSEVNDNLEDTSAPADYVKEDDEEDGKDSADEAEEDANDSENDPDDDKGDDVTVTDDLQGMEDEAALYRDELIEKICELPPRTLGSYHRFKAICSVLFTTCGDAEMNTQVTWSCDFAERGDATNLTVTIPAGQEPNRSFAAVFRRNPGFHSLRHLSARLQNNTAGEDLSFVSAQIIYEYRGRQR